MRSEIEDALALLLDGQVVEDDAIMRAIDEHFRMDEEMAFPFSGFPQGEQPQNGREATTGKFGREMQRNQDAPEADGVEEPRPSLLSEITEGSYRLRDRSKIRPPLPENEFAFDGGVKKRRKTGVIIQELVW